MPVHAMAHITGGGLSDNLPRVLPEGLEAVLERRSWHRDPVFDWLQSAGRIEPAQMRSEEHTSELQSQSNLVCRLLLEKKKKKSDQRQVGGLHYYIDAVATTTLS